MPVRFTVLLLTGVLTFVCHGLTPLDSTRASDQPGSKGRKPMATVRVRVIGPDGRLTPPVDMPKMILSDAEWKKRLTAEQFRITRSQGTERAFCGGLLKNKEAGVYVCICCNLPLFESSAKFESGTGWPSFFKPIADENIHEEMDRSHGMVRIEIQCARCDAHLGHVFADGPPPTGRRHCLNSEALRFVAENQLKTIAEIPPTANAARAASPAAANGGDREAELAEAVFAGGCFWCVEAVFEQLDGVVDAISGYAGGEAETANCQAVCTGKTGHAEAVKIIYDPKKIAYEELLKVHFATHDPTTLNRQGNDVGPQYRSALFYASEEEKQLAEAFLADLQEAKIFKRPIVTTLEPLKIFYPAEAYHQDYVACNRAQPYVRAVALPKVKKVRAKFKDQLKSQSEAESR